MSTRKRTMEAVKSRLSVPPENGLSMGLLRRLRIGDVGGQTLGVRQRDRQRLAFAQRQETAGLAVQAQNLTRVDVDIPAVQRDLAPRDARRDTDGSEEHTSELQSLMRISYAVFCLKKKKRKNIKP